MLFRSRGNIAALDRAGAGAISPVVSLFEEVAMPILSWAVATTATLKGVALGLAVGAAAATRHARKQRGGER